MTAEAQTQASRPFGRPYRPVRVALGALLLAGPISVLAGVASIPHIFQSGDPIIASELNDNFVAMKSAIDDNHARIGDLSGLQTNAKGDLVQAVNEVAAAGGSGLPSGTVVLSETYPNAALVSAGFQALGASPFTPGLSRSSLPVTESLSFPTGVWFQGAAWTYGGEGSAKSNSVFSNDPIGNGTLVNKGAAAWSPRSGAAAVVFDSTALGEVTYLYGGNGSIALNDIWLSLDGRTFVPPSYFGLFTAAQDTAPWSGRWGHAAVSHSGKCWIFGGVFTETDIWSSDDGVSWTLVNPSAFPTLPLASGASFDGLLWAHGVNRDLFSSVDGVSWASEAVPATGGATRIAAFAGRLFYVTASKVFSRDTATAPWEEWIGVNGVSSFGALIATPSELIIWGALAGAPAQQIEYRIQGQPAGSSNFVPEMLGRFYLFRR